MYRIFLLLMVFSVPGLTLLAQGESQAALLARLRESRPDTNRVSLLLKAGCYHLLKPGNEKKDLDSAFSFFNPALELSRMLHADKWVMESLKWKGDCYLEGNELTPGEACFEEVIDYYRRTDDKRKEAETWARLGECIPPLNKAFFAEIVKSLGQARELFRQVRDTLNELESLKNIADIHLNTNRLDLAEQELLQVLAGYKAIHYPKLHYTYDLLRSVYDLKGELQQEIFCVIELIKSMESSGDLAEANFLYTAASASYYRVGMYDQSLSCARKAEAISLNRGFVGMFRYRKFIVLDLLAKDSVQAAQRYLSGYDRQNGKGNGQFQDYLHYVSGIYYAQLKQYTLADKYFAQALNMEDSFWSVLHRGPEGLGGPIMYESIGEYWLLRHDIPRASGLREKIERMIKQSVPVSVVARCRFELFQFELDSAKGFYHSAMLHHLSYKHLSDSVYNIQKNIQMQELQIKYETDQKDKDLRSLANNIQLLTKQTQLQQSQAEKSRLLRNTMIGGLGLSLLLVGVIYNRYRLKQRKNRQLEVQQQEITAKNTQLQKLLHENEWLLREVHHRVKNNLQVVMSLLYSQSAYLQDEKALSAVLESQHRVQAMALIHQKLYKSDNATSIYMPEYITDLVEYLKNGFNIRQSIWFDLQIEKIDLDIVHAVPVGLILNEAITNAIKYAFPHGEDDHISVRLFNSAPDQITLIISDNGRGIPAGSALGRNGSFGMTLIKGLTEDMDGALSIESDDGTTLHMVFKIETAIKKTASGLAQRQMAI
jgi:two-component system, sensor histidine kinase PdtaS